MKMVKSLLLGSAAGVVAMAGAQAADLPVKAKPVQYVKICSLYGAGFYYIPGTDTCIKIGGFVRAEMNFNAGHSFSVNLSDHSKRTYNFEATRVRWGLSTDTRTQTAYGTLRTYWNGTWQASSSDAGSGVGNWSNRGFIQWAGFTFGLATSFFDFEGMYSNTINIWNSDTGGVGDPVFAYTAQFGNGFSATVSAEDTSVRRTGIYDTSNASTVWSATGAGTNTSKTSIGTSYAGRQWPDFVGNLRVDQAWGSAQVMGAVHQVRGAASVNKAGWAVGGGLKVNLPWGKGDVASFQAAYAEGALKYLGRGLSNSFSVSENGTTFAYGQAYDAVSNGTTSWLTTGWSITAGMEHHWDSMWKTSLYGSYGEISYDNGAAAAVGATNGGLDWSLWQIGSRTVWSPVKGLAFSVDLLYNSVDSASWYAPGGTTTAALKTNSGTVGWFSGMFRVQRNY